MPIALDPPYLPEVPGDPAGMRVLAGTMRGHAGAVGGLASGVESDVSGMTFEGPAAEDFRSRMNVVTQMYRDAQTELHDLARQLEASAAEVEAQQAARALRLAQLGAEYHVAQRQLAAGAAP
jgi:uncharacterized protein YukE